MKKNFLIFCFICLFLFFINPKMVKAYVLPDGSYTLECIYDDGGLYTLEFYDGSIITNRTPYNLHGVANSEANGGGAYEFKNQLGIRNVSDGAYRCQTEMYMAKFDDTNFYKFGEKFKACTDDKCEEFNARTNGWYAFWGTETDENYEKAKSAINKANNNPYLLVSESITFNGDAPDPKVTLYYIKDNGTAKQAASSNSYIKIFSYDNNHTFLEKDGEEYVKKIAIKNITSLDLSNIGLTSEDISDLSM